MGSPIFVRNAVDTFTDANTPTRPRPESAKLKVRSSGPVRYAWIFFSSPWPEGARIQNAVLRMYGGPASAATITLTAKLPTAKWGVNKIDHPGPTTSASPSAFQQRVAPAAGSEWEINVTALIQACSDGQDWFGFRIESNSATDYWLHSTQSSTSGMRPVLEVTWSDEPEKPSYFSPAGGRSTSLAKPFLRTNFTDVLGDITMNAIQVQVDALGDFTTGIDFDSGTFATNVPEYDLATSAYAGLADGGSMWWRPRVRDGSNVWSEWGDPVQVFRHTHGVLTITAPSAAQFFSPTPVVTWTFTGRTQKKYQVIVTPADESNNWLWDSGVKTGTETSVQIPFGVMVDANALYRVVVRVWDTIDREPIPGDPGYVQAVRNNIAFAYDSTVAEVTSFSASSDPLYPFEILQWNRVAGATDFIVQRSEDAGVTWEYVSMHDADDVFVSGTTYTVKDTTAASYTPYIWRVLALVGNVQSGDNPVASGEVRRLAPFLYRPDGTDAVVFMNPRRSRQSLDIQEVHTVLGDAPPVVVTQKLGGEAGTVSGEFADNILTGVTAKEMKKRFKAIRADSGMKMKLAIADETLTVVPFNMEIETRTSTSGIYYIASFDYVEV